MSSHIELVGSPESCSNISSGHYMVSNLDDCSSSEEDDLPQTIVEAQHASQKMSPDWHAKSRMSKLNGNSKQHPYVFRANTKKNAMVSDRDISHLAKLFECLRVYSEQLTTPRWNNFRSLRLSRTDRIRLNNLIWREFYTQHIRHLKPVFVKFETPSLENHQRPRSVVLEGKYWKRRFDSVCLEYLRWRCYYKLRFSGSGYSGDVSDAELLEKADGHQQQNILSSLDDAMDTEDLLSDLVSNLEWLLDGSTTTAGGMSVLPGSTAMPKTPPIEGGNNNADMIQPLLLQMTSNLEENNDLLQNIFVSPPSSPMPSATNSDLSMSPAPISYIFPSNPPSVSGTTQTVNTTMIFPATSFRSSDPMASGAQQLVATHQPQPGVMMQPMPEVLCPPRVHSVGGQSVLQQKKRQVNSLTTPVLVTLPPGFNCSPSTSTSILQPSPVHVDPASFEIRPSGSGPVPARCSLQPCRKEPYTKRRKKLAPQSMSRHLTAIAPKPSTSSVTGNVECAPCATPLPRRTAPLAELASPMARPPHDEDFATINCQRLLSDVNLGLRGWRQAGVKTEASSSLLVVTDTDCPSSTAAFDAANLQPLVIRPSSSDGEFSLNSSEGRRRCSINQGLMMLHSLLPEGVCSGPGAKLIPMSKAMILLRSSEYIRDLRRELAMNDQRLEILRNDVEKLQLEINECCSKLPATGLPMPPSAKDKGQRWFRAYIRASTLRNSKFYIFSLIAEKLFSAYTSLVSMGSVHDFTASIMTWLEQRCSMANLRDYVRGALMKLSTKTSVLTDPSLLPQESIAAVSESDAFSN